MKLSVLFDGVNVAPSATVKSPVRLNVLDLASSVPLAIAMGPLICHEPTTVAISSGGTPQQGIAQFGI